MDLAAIGVDDLSLSECFDDLVASLIRFSKPSWRRSTAWPSASATILLHCDIVMVADTAKLRSRSRLSEPRRRRPQRPAAASRRDSEGGRPAPHVTLHHRNGGGTDRSTARCLPEASLHSEAQALARELTEMPDAALATAKRLMRHGAADVTRQALDRERAAAIFLHDELGPMGDMA